MAIQCPYELDAFRSQIIPKFIHFFIFVARVLAPTRKN